MSISAPALAGATLPQVAKDGYRETAEWRGGYTEMASGIIARDLLSTEPKYKFELHWVALSVADVATILDAYGDTVAADAQFTSPYGDTYTVQPEDARGIDVQHYAVAGGTRADVTMRLREA